MECTQNKILLIDHEIDILKFYDHNLRQQGYTVFSCTNGNQAIEIAEKETPELIIMDLLTDTMNGLAICKKLRAMNNLSASIITFLTTQTEDHYLIKGFGAGADSFITKPINPTVLISRVKAILKRHGHNSAPNRNISSLDKITFDDTIIDRETYLVCQGEKKIQLPKLEFELLAFLASNPGRVFTRDEIIKFVWRDNIIIGNKTVDVHVHKLREKIGKDYFQTVRGIGYKFNC